MKFAILFATLIAVSAANLAPYAINPTFYNAPFAYGYNNAPYAYGYNYGYPANFGYSYGYNTFAGAPVVAPAAAVIAKEAAPVLKPVAYAAAYPAYGAQYQNQFRSQDAFGNYAFGYQGDTSARQEVSNGGVTQGSFSYVDANNQVQSRSYVADALGFRVAGTDVPAAPVPVVAPVAVGYAAAPVPVAAPAVVVKAAYEGGPGYVPVEGIDVPFKTPEVKAAEAEHFAAHAAALVRHKREALPSGYKSSRNSYPIRSVAVPARQSHGQKYAKKSHAVSKSYSNKKVWKREADPEPRKGLTHGSSSRSYGHHQRSYQKKHSYKKW